MSAIGNRTKVLPNRKSLGKLVAKRTPLNSEKVPFIVCWSQKSGCTSILKWYLYHAGLLNEAINYREGNGRLEIHNYENRVFKARAGYRSELVDQIQSGKPIVSFIRCPYARVFSSYMQLNTPQQMRLYNTGIVSPTMKLREQVQHFLYGDTVGIEHPISFLDYLHWLDKQDLSNLDPHHTPQYTPLYDHFPARHYKLENFDTAISQIEEEFSLDDSMSMRASFSSGHHLDKVEMSAPEALAFLERGVPSQVSAKFKLPKVSRRLLEGTKFDTVIKSLFAQDLALYDSINM